MPRFRSCGSIRWVLAPALSLGRPGAALCGSGEAVRWYRATLRGRQTPQGGPFRAASEAKERVLSWTSDRSTVTHPVSYTHLTLPTNREV